MEKVGLLAGIGNLPVAFMRAAQQSGHAVVVIAVVPMWHRNWQKKPMCTTKSM